MEINCSDPWFTYIKNGTKKIEGRKASEKYKNIKYGDIIKFVNNSISGKTESFKAKVVNVWFYKDLTNYLTSEGVSNCLPGITDLNKGIEIYHQWYSDEEIKNGGGFMGICVEVMNE
jgi:ASC-1-like (ASCH) protein